MQQNFRRIQSKKDVHRKYKDAVIAAGGLAVAFFIFYGPVLAVIKLVAG